jgi:hypothetical protein
LPAGGLRFLLGTVGEMRLQQDPPTVIELGPFLPAKQGATLGKVAVGNQGFCKRCGSFPTTQERKLYTRWRMTG